MFLDPLIDYEYEAAYLFRWFCRRDSVKIDNLVFFLHYKLTFGILIAGSVLVTSGLYVFDPIECISDSSVQDVIDSFCWIHSTFTVPGLWNGSNEFVPHPGISTADPNSTDVKFHGYYQWICYVLAIQAMVFCIPRVLWISLEGKKTRMLLSEIQKDFAIDSNIANDLVDDNCDSDKNRALEYFVENMGKHNNYYKKLVFCEFLNLAITVGQFFFTNVFLGYEVTRSSFWDIIKVLTVNDPLKREDMIAQTFPKMTKCEFRTHGPSGSIQNHDALCILSLNVINEKIYLSLWLWLFILAVLTSLVLVYRALLLIPQFRLSVLKHKTRSQEIQSFNSFRTNLQVGDWLILNQLSANMDPMQFTQFIKHLLYKLKQHV